MTSRIIMTVLYGVSLLDGIGITLESGCAASGDLRKQSAHLINAYNFLERKLKIDIPMEMVKNIYFHKCKEFTRLSSKQMHT